MTKPGPLLQQIKDHLGIKTDAHLARVLGVSGARLAMWRRRGRISADGLRLLWGWCVTLGVPVTPEQIFGDRQDAAAAEPTQPPFVVAYDDAA